MGSVFNGPERRSPRVAARIPVRLLLNGDNTKPGQSAHTVDLSDRGVRIRTHSALTQGDVDSHRLLGGQRQTHAVARSLGAA